MPPQEETGLSDERPASQSSVDVSSDATEFTSRPTQYQYRVRWRRNGWTHDKTRRYEQRYYARRFMRKLAADPTWDHRARPVNHIAIDRREVIPGWETVEEWTDGEI